MPGSSDPPSRLPRSPQRLPGPGALRLPRRRRGHGRPAGGRAAPRPRRVSPRRERALPAREQPAGPWRWHPSWGPLLCPAAPAPQRGSSPFPAGTGSGGWWHPWCLARCATSPAAAWPRSGTGKHWEGSSQRRARPTPGCPAGTSCPVPPPGGGAALGAGEAARRGTPGCPQDTRRCSPSCDLCPGRGRMGPGTLGVPAQPGQALPAPAARAGGCTRASAERRRRSCCSSRATTAGPS